MSAILISSAGRRVELVHCFRADAQSLGLNWPIIAVDTNPEMSSACHAADKFFRISRCTDAQFIPELLDICSKEDVRLIVPTIDTELEILAAQQAQFQKYGVRVVVSSPAVVSMARDKEATARYLSEHGFPVPRTVRLKDLLEAPKSLGWPVILKPVNGSSSIGIRIAHTFDEAKAAGAARTDLIAQELLRGREYTVNVFFDRSGSLRSAVPHLRYETRAGEVSKGITERNSALTDIAWKLGEKLQGAAGPLCFQAIIPDNKPPCVFEINARFGGGYPLAHKAGATFTKWLLEEAADLRFSANDQWQDGLVMLRYDAAIFSTNKLK